jgi:hypothetical protein
MADVTPKRARELFDPLAPPRPLAKKVAVEYEPVRPGRLFDRNLMFTELNVYGERVVRHPPPVFQDPPQVRRNRFAQLIEPYPGK